MRRVILAAIVLGVLLGGNRTTFALNPSLDISQYGHTSWTVRDGFALGNIYAMAQTPDGYLWLASEFGLFRFDGVRRMLWQPPAGQHLPDGGAYSLRVTRDGTLWIGTFAGLLSWDGTKLTNYPELDGRFITSMLEDGEGTVWAGTLGGSLGSNAGQLCAIRRGRAQCNAEGGAFGSFVWGLSEDSSGALWAGAESGLWRWKPGSPQRYPMPQMRISDLSKSDDGRLLIAVNSSGLREFKDDRVASYPLRAATDPKRLLREDEVDSNKLLRDRNGGLWIGTVQRGLIHVHDGGTDEFRKQDGLSGDIVMCLFEDREGNIWVATTEGVDRFRELPVTKITAKQGLSSDLVDSVVAGADGSVWVGTQQGLTRWKDGQIAIFSKGNGLPDDKVQSLYQDGRGRIWVSTLRGLVYFSEDRFVAVNGVPSEEVYSITGDKTGDIWLSGNRGLSHLRDGHFVEQFPWTALRRQQQAKVLVADQGGLWLSFWKDGGVDYFKNGQLRASYSAKDGLGKGAIPGLLLDSDGALWASTEEGGLSRIKDGHIATITTRNGLPCNAIHWSAEDNDRSLWLYAGCGLVRIARDELDAWIADPTRKVQTRVWDSADGVAIHFSSPSSFGPTFAKSTDGKLWLMIAEGIEVVDPHHLAFNSVPPPIHIEKIVADNKTYWENLPGAAASSLRLPALTRDLEIDYTALSLVAPEKVQFRVKLEGQDKDWRVPVNPRHSHYTNLPPGPYRFRVIASNNSGVWNEQGDALEFTIDPAFYQTIWFRLLCGIALLMLAWVVYQLRVRQIHRAFSLTLETRVAERTRIAREIHDTLLQSAHGLIVQLEVVSQTLLERPVEARQRLDRTIEQAAETITQGRDAVQGLRASTLQTNDLARSINTLGEELANDSTKHGSPAFHVTVEGEARDLHPILRDEIYRIAAEALRNAFHHAQARQVEVEIRYDNQQFRLRVRDDGKGIDSSVLSGQGREGHFGMPGMRERADEIGGKLVIWSEVGAGTELELRIPAATAYVKTSKHSWVSDLLSRK